MKNRVGLVPRASGFVGGKSDASVYAVRQESMACRKAAHTHADRVIIGPSDVTSESKTDTNAGSTAASGFGNSVHDLVGHVEVAQICCVKRRSVGAKLE